MSVADELRRWLPSPLLKGSAAFHVAAVAAVAAGPAIWPLAVGGLIANHLIISACGLVPRAAILGPNLTRLPPTGSAPAIAITIDDGPDPEVTPKVLEILERYQARATFFCIGTRVASFPDIAREIVRRGHSIENHSLNHFYRFSTLGPGLMSDEISGAQELITAVVGTAPRFFRAPAGLRNPFLEPILLRMGLRLASWTRRGFDTVARDPDVVRGKLLKRLAARDILLLHDGNAARTPGGVPVILEVLPKVLDAAALAGLRTLTLAGAFS